MPRRAGSSASSAQTTTGTAPPTFQRISAEQVDKYAVSGNVIGVALAQLAPGEGGLIDIKGMDATRVRVIKRQYTLAAQKVGNWTLEWFDPTNNMLPFKVAMSTQPRTTTGSNGDGRHQNLGSTVRTNRGRPRATASV